MIGLMMLVAAAKPDAAPRPLICPPMHSCSYIPPPPPPPPPPTDPVQLAILRARICVEDPKAQIGAFGAVAKLSDAADAQTMAKAREAIGRHIAKRQEQKQCILSLAAFGREPNLTEEERLAVAKAIQSFSIDWYANAFATDVVTFKLLNPSLPTTSEPPLPFPRTAP